ncbi:hypothetical protein [Massilia alkalitolerans]|uniref:hypothetical protein n=1 Tax=Massilia alkalitolerans TaxID=286638 RepID=UPI000417D4AD|nr:hypothetical protein [Massilia alkalitolerans]
MRMSIKSNFPAMADRISELGRQGPFVAAVALTRTAQDVQAAIKDEMRTSFDRPTAYALNGMFLKRATKTDLEARVWVKDNPFGKGVPADRFLGPQIFGGERRHKGSERLLQAAGLMPQGSYLVPAAGAQLDGNGNIRRGQLRQILSQLKVQGGAGHESRATGSQRSNRTIARQGVTYFALPNGNRGLLPGVYLKRRFGHGSAIRPVFIFVSKVEYQTRLKFHEVGQATVATRFPVHFESELAKAMRTARL